MTSKPNINYTLKHDLCTGCGICEGVCPNEAITTIVKNGRFLPSIDNSLCKNSKGCHRCYDACPGVGVYLTILAKEYFTDEGIKEDNICGRYLKCYTGFSSNYNIRCHSASGGVVTQFLIWLLEKEKIDGAVVTKFDKDSLFKVKSVIATTKEDILAAKSSKYAPVSLHDAVKKLKEAPDGRYVVVGLPCHIEGMRKLMGIDRKLREKVVGLFGIYCSGSRTFYMTEYLMKSRNIDIDKLNFLAYRDNGCLGGMVAKGDNIDFYEDYQSYCHPLRTMFHPRRCLLCVDHFAELADISFGDIHVEPYKNDKVGVNSLVVRSTEWHDLLLEAAQFGCLELSDLDKDILIKSQTMAKIKKSRYMGTGLFLKKLGRVVPDYDTTYGAGIKPQYIIGYIRNSFDRFIGSHKFLWPLIKVIKSKVNIH